MCNLEAERTPSLAATNSKAAAAVHELHDEPRRLHNSSPLSRHVHRLGLGRRGSSLPARTRRGATRLITRPVAKLGAMRKRGAARGRSCLLVGGGCEAARESAALNEAININATSLSCGWPTRSSSDQRESNRPVGGQLATGSHNQSIDRLPTPVDRARAPRFLSKWTIWPQTRPRALPARLAPGKLEALVCAPALDLIERESDLGDSATANTRRARARCNSIALELAKATQSRRTMAWLPPAVRARETRSAECPVEMAVCRGAGGPASPTAGRTNKGRRATSAISLTGDCSSLRA